MYGFIVCPFSIFYFFVIIFYLFFKFMMHTKEFSSVSSIFENIHWQLQLLHPFLYNERKRIESWLCVEETFFEHHPNMDFFHFFVHCTRKMHTFIGFYRICGSVGLCSFDWSMHIVFNAKKGKWKNDNVHTLRMCKV